MNAEEAAELREALRHLLATVRPTHADIASALVEEEWLEVDADGAPGAVWTLIAEVCAEELAPVHVLDLFVAHALTPDDPAIPVAYVVGDVLDGEPSTTARLFGRAADASRGRVLVVDDTRADAPEALLVAEDSLAQSPAHDFAEGLDMRRFDWTRNTGVLERLDPAAIPRARVIQGRILASLSTRMLALARDHAASRTQFGVPIGSFQAVKHLLADCVIEMESARAALDYADDTGDPLAARVARALAGRTAFRVGRATQQVSGAMGFSWEWSLQHYVRRAHVEDLRLGPWQHSARVLGQSIAHLGAVPVIGGA
jgi:hypothetical protein